MPWETSDRRDRLPSNWRDIRKRVLQRDNYRCVWVEADGTPCNDHATDVDHIQRGDDHSLTNLQSLCSWHHKRKTAAEANAAKPKLAPRNRPKEQHWGFL